MNQEELAFIWEWDQEHLSGGHTVIANMDRTLFACEDCDWVGTDEEEQMKHLFENAAQMTDDQFWERDCAFEAKFGYSPRLRFLERHNPGDRCDG